MCMLYLLFTNNDYTGVVYTPTIINACVYRDDESTRLNVWWKVCVAAIYYYAHINFVSKICIYIHAHD